MSVVHSCLERRRRKIRCDKDSPCSHCVRARVRCEYPAVESSGWNGYEGSTATSRASAVITSLRIQALEDQVQQLSSALSKEQLQKDERVLQTAPTRIEPWLTHPASALHTNGSCFQHFKLRATPDGELPVPQWSIDHTRQLWSSYVADIDPCFGLVDHQQVEEMLELFPKICASRMAVLIAMAFAVTSCKYPTLPTEYHEYAKALEKALMCAKVLTQPSVLGLQAMTIYLSCGRLNMDQDYLRTMLLVLVRVATNLQLNRDPKELGVDPRESEIRRRLWWQIITLDVRTAEASGSQPLIITRHIEVKTPVMPRTVHLGKHNSVERLGNATCTCFSTMSFEMVKIARQVLFGLGPNGQATRDDKHQLREEADQLHSTLLERFLTGSNCADIPICRLTIQWCSIHWTRLKLLVSHSKRMFLRGITEDSTFNHDADLSDCIEILERVARLRDDPDYSRWAWLWQNCIEWDVSAIALCMIATGRCSHQIVKNAWVTLEAFFNDWSSTNFGGGEHQRRWSELLAFRDWVRFTSSATSSPCLDDTA